MGRLEYTGELPRPDRTPIDPGAIERAEKSVMEAGLKWAEENKPKGDWQELAEQVAGKPTFEIRRED